MKNYELRIQSAGQMNISFCAHNDQKAFGFYAKIMSLQGDAECHGAELFRVKGGKLRPLRSI